MFTFVTCTAVPVGGGRWYSGGDGVVEVEGRVVWEGRLAVYRFDEVRSESVTGWW